MQAHQDCVTGAGGNQVFFLEHDAVITKGRRLHGSSIPQEQKILESGIEIREADRGGLLTYHGPGQLVVYFVLRLQEYFPGISQMVHELELMIQSYLLHHGLVGRTDEAHPGIWVNDRKVASIGLRVSDGVTRHGISLNLNTDLSVYQLFDPCGLTGQTMGNIGELVSNPVSLSEAKQELRVIIEERLQHTHTCK